MADAQKFLSVLGEFEGFFLMFFSDIFSMESLKNARITTTHVYFSALTLAVSLGSSLNARPGGPRVQTTSSSLGKC